MASIPKEILFNDSRYAKLREQWCAGVFGAVYRSHFGYCRVAVNESCDTSVDFFLEANGLVFPFQVVEALEPGRKRGQEYKDFAAGESTS